MEPKYKDNRQFGGQTYKTMPATPDGEAPETFEENDELYYPMDIEHYSLKKSAIDIAIEFARLTDGPTLKDVLTIAALCAEFIASKK